jgi:F-type H+-transporting ATPase subunit epsilon
MATDAVANKIHLEIVTPKGRALDASVDEVTAPSVDGEFGVMPGHLPLLAALRTGLVTYRIGRESKTCAVGGGFAEAGPDKLVILTDEYTTRDQIDPVIVRKGLAEVQAQIAKVENVAEKDPDADESRLLLFAKENWLAAQLELYGDPPAATMRPHEEWGPPGPPDADDVPQEDPSST